MSYYRMLPLIPEICVDKVLEEYCCLALKNKMAWEKMFPQFLLIEQTVGRDVMKRTSQCLLI